MYGRRLSEEMLDQLRTNHSAAIAEAATRIAEADVLLLCTGAGFSADSGLAVYADVARVPAYAQRGLKYHDICNPRWLGDEPELFWGFWGQCFNDYRNTAPHEGYQIISSWADRFRHSSFADAVRQRYEDRLSSKASKTKPPYAVHDSPGAFFAFTSNVDAHHFDCFAASEIRECHGNTELYQCVSRRCKRHIWRAPLNFRFHVDKITMHARDGLPAENRTTKQVCVVCEGTGLLLDDPCPLCEGMETFFDEVHQEEASPGMPCESAPRIGHVRGGGRPTALQYMPGPALDSENVGFARNHPVCPVCKGPARPAILMFGDFGWQDFMDQEDRWSSWSAAVTDEIKHRARTKVRAVILEFGAGCNVPTVRRTSEKKLRTWQKAGAEACLVRVNPDFPLSDQPQKEGAVISILATGLPTIHQINAALLGEASTARDENAEGSVSANGVAPTIPDPDDWVRIQSLFEGKAQGKTTISIEDAYRVILSEEERNQYCESDFVNDVRSLKKAAGHERVLDGVTLPEIRRFLEIFA